MFIMCCFFKQKTAYEMRISDWSSDVCSSDLPDVEPVGLSTIDRQRFGGRAAQSLFFGRPACSSVDALDDADPVAGRIHRLRIFGVDGDCRDVRQFFALGDSVYPTPGLSTVRAAVDRSRAEKEVTGLRVDRKRVAMSAEG